MGNVQQQHHCFSSGGHKQLDSTSPTRLHQSEVTIVSELSEEESINFPINRPEKFLLD